MFSWQHVPICMLVRCDSVFCTCNCGLKPAVLGGACMPGPLPTRSSLHPCRPPRPPQVYFELHQLIQAHKKDFEALAAAVAQASTPAERER